MIIALSLLTLAQGAAPAAGPACPVVAGVWGQPDNSRILVMEQQGCDLTATVQEPRAVLRVRGFWSDGVWVFAATRSQGDGCGTTAWGTLRAADANRLLINVRGTDGLCGSGKPAAIDATMTYLRKTPANLAPAGCAPREAERPAVRKSLKARLETFWGPPG
ncbi:MAG TPA: hypothetical protein VF699_09500 [Caulobacteraceae bacterium]